MSTGSVAPFALAGSVTIAATTTATTAACPPAGDVVVITNLASSAAYVSLSQPAAVGGVNCAVVLPGQKRIMAINIYVDAVSAVLVSGSGSVVFEVGTGAVT